MSGGISVMHAIVLPGLVGLVGLGVETGYWYVEKRTLQTQADAAAMGGAWEVAWDRDDQITASATNEAERNGFPNDPAITTITVNNPPTSGSEVGNEAAVEVIVTQDFTPMFAGIVMGSDVTIAARAVSTGIGSGKACILALNGTASDAAKNTGSTSIDAPDCIIAANSTADDAISFGGNATIVFDSAWTAGGVEIDGGSVDLTLSEDAKENMWTIQDPYADLSDVAPSGCDYSNEVYSGWQTDTIEVTSGEVTFCNGLLIEDNAVVDLEPGTYWMKGGSLIVQGNASFICSACAPGGDGVTLIFTAPDGGDVNQIGTFRITGTATVELNAPNESPTGHDGILFFQDPDTPKEASKSAVAAGGSDTTLNGAIYFPNNEVQWAGNTTMAATCTVIVADTVTFTGNSGLSVADCASQGIEIPSVQRVFLVE